MTARPQWEHLLRSMHVDATADACTIVFVGAHPDDEVIGAGATLLHDAPRCTVVHVTDGAPRDLRDAHAAGFPTREAYAAARRAEARAALALARRGPVQIVALDIEDQRASHVMDAIALRLCAVLREVSMPVVVTHPYEGGHPDHDAACFAVHTACAMLRAHALHVPLIEFTSYHDVDGRTRYGEFLPHEAAGPTIAFPLSPAEQTHKRQLFQCYASQQEVLRWIPADVERFRPAPRYHFAAAPHSGTLHYERHPWGMTGERWRALAAAATNRLRDATP